MKNSFNSLKAISSITVAGLSLLAMPLITISAEAVEEKSRSKVRLSHNSANIITTDIEMTEEDAAYIYTLREHYHLD